MAFIYKSNKSTKESRNHVIELLRQEKKQNPNFRVLDVGGGFNSWADEVVDAYVDINQPNSIKKVYVGDINSNEVWDQIEQAVGKYDFTICTHTLEDIRDPVFVLKQLMRVSKAGYISFPNKHTEFSNHESNFWVGAAHHRWIFTLKSGSQGDFLFFMPKWPGVAFFNPRYSNFWIQLKRLLRVTNKDRQLTARRMPWFDKNLSTDKNELGFIWENSIPYQFHDFTPSARQMLIDYKLMLADGL